MYKIIRNVSLATLLATAAVVFWQPALVLAGNCTATDTKGAITCGTTSTSGAPISANPEQSINDTITSIINVLSVIGGVIAVVMLIVGGYKFMTAAGDSSKVASARTAVTFAIIGLIIVALAQVIARFVLNQTANSQTGIGGTSQSQGTGGGCRGNNPPPGCTRGN